MPPKRLPLQPHLVRKLCEYFGVGPADDLRCVVTGNRAFPYPLHQEDEVRPNFANYIPLSPELFEMLSRSGELDGRLDPLNRGGLEHTYRSHLNSWKPAYAYACARLASHVCRRPAYRGKYISQVVEWAANALYCIRSNYDPELVESTIQYDIIWQTLGKITPVSGQRLALEVAAYWSEYGNFENADKWLSLAKRFETASSQTSDYDKALRSANLQRRQAQIEIHSDPANLSSNKRLDKASYLLPTGQISFAATKAIVRVNRSFLLADNFSAAASDIEKVFSLYSSVFGEGGIGMKASGLSAATAAELYLFSGVVQACLYSDIKTAESRFCVAESLLDASGHKLPLYIWRYIVRLPYRNPKFALRIKSLNARYVNNFDIPPELESSFEELMHKLVEAIPERRYTMQKIYQGPNYHGSIGTVNNFQGDNMANHFGVSTEQLKLVQELMTMVAKINSTCGLDSTQKIEINNAAQHVGDSVPTDATKPMNLHKAAICGFRNIVMAIATKVTTDEVAPMLGEQLKNMAKCASELLQMLPH